ncbi:MAG: hypothetical protein ABI175_28930 [Polyangiales bacterium]
MSSQSPQSSIGAGNPIQRVREFFVLKDAEARSAKLPADVREGVARDVAIARQKREASEVLWLGGGPAEALVLARAGFELVAKAVERAHDAGGAPALPATVPALRAKLETTPLPGLDTEIVDADTPRFFELLAAHDELRALVVPASLSQPELAQKRRSRIGWAIAAAMFTVLVGYYLFRTPRVLKPEASATYDEAHNATKSVDGRPETEWLLPNGQPGSIDFTVIPARKLKRIKLLNGHNPPFNDRQIQEYRIEVYGSGGKVLKTIDGTFGEFSEAPVMLPIELDVSDKVERFRVEVKTFHKAGGSLAEVEVE